MDTRLPTSSLKSPRKRLSSKEPSSDIDDLEKWAALANKLTNDDVICEATEKTLFEDNVNRLRGLKKEIQSTNWMFSNRIF